MIEIVERLTENRQIERAKSILESNGYNITRLLETDLIRKFILENILNSLNSDVPDTPIIEPTIKCSNSATLNAMYYVMRGENVVLELGNIGSSLPNRITHVWIRHNGEILQTYGSPEPISFKMKYGDTLFANVSIDLIPNDLEGSKSRIRRVIEELF